MAIQLERSGEERGLQGLLPRMRRPERAAHARRARNMTFFRHTAISTAAGSKVLSSCSGRRGWLAACCCGRSVLSARDAGAAWLLSPRVRAWSVGSVPLFFAAGLRV